MKQDQVRKQDYEGPREKGGQNAGRSQSRTGLKPVRRGTAPSAEYERVVTDLTEGLTRSVQTSKNNSLQCGSGEELQDRARSYPERR